MSRASSSSSRPRATSKLPGARGSGLGLSIVRAVCDAHGGTVSAVARPGGGLEVIARLPAAATTPVLAGTATVPAS